MTSPGGVSQPRRENPLVAETRLLLTAVMFYTRIPCPAWIGYSDEQMTRSVRYFPAVGWLVGVIVAAVTFVARLVFPIPVAVVLGLAAGVLVTGAFHEDGFADVCDGLGGGATKQRALEIMKDSRVGAFAAIGLVLLFGLKIAAYSALLADVRWAGLAALVFAHVVSRWCAVTIMVRNAYARDDGTSKVRAAAGTVSWLGRIVATAWLLPFVGLAWWHPWWLVAIPAAFAVRLLLARWFNRRLGGYTGDCLGAAQQITEVVTVLVCLGLAGAGL